jgi:hypothetical protein
MRLYFVAMIIGGVTLPLLQPTARAEVLITEAEARLPASPVVPMQTRGLTRGPGIEQVSPSPALDIQSPFSFKIALHNRNRIEIDLSSVKLTYIKAQPVDLTDRVRKYLTSSGIDMARAEAPPGTHWVRLDLKDRQGRVSTAIIKLTIAAK